MTVAFITQSAPYGRSEAFAIAEINALRRQGLDVRTVPVRPGRSMYHTDGRVLASTSVRAALMSMPVLGAALAEVASRPLVAIACARLVLKSRTTDHFFRNLAVVPKGLWLARWARHSGVTHFHAYWATTPATVAAVASLASGVPFSFTAHAWDIEEDNLLSAKVGAARWVRTIADAGRAALVDIVGSAAADKTTTVHLGVEIPLKPVSPSRRDEFVFVTVASLEPRKGHIHLLTAFRRLRQEQPETSLRLILIGDGPLRTRLERQATLLGLARLVEFRGGIPHQALLAAIDAGAFDAMVLPSADGVAEGIPVALMEAMARGLPVIATDSGGTRELVAGGGHLVPQGDAGALADAMRSIASHPPTRARIGRAARRKVIAQFDVDLTTRRLADLLLLDLPEGAALVAGTSD